MGYKDQDFGILDVQTTPKKVNTSRRILQLNGKKSDESIDFHSQICQSKFWPELEQQSTAIGVFVGCLEWILVSSSKVQVPVPSPSPRWLRPVPC